MGTIHTQEPSLGDESRGATSPPNKNAENSWMGNGRCVANCCKDVALALGEMASQTKLKPIIAIAAVSIAPSTLTNRCKE